MRSNRPPCLRPVLAGLVIGLSLGAVGCGASSQPGTLAPTQEADQQAAQKSAELRKQRMKTAKAKSPRSSGGSVD